MAFAALAGLSANAVADDDWRFRLTPYVWLAGVRGDVSTLPGQPSAPIDVSARDAAADAQATLMALFEVKKEKQGLLAEVFYGKVQPETELIPAIGLKLHATSKSWMASLAYLYEIIGAGQTSLDLFAGARYWRFDTQLEFSGGLGILAGKSIREVQDWVDPMLGVKGRVPLGSSKFFVAGGLAFGGLNPDSDWFYDVSAHVGYQWAPAIATTLGYRRIDVKYEKGDYLYDVVQQGWALGLTWAF